jgi:hypothetical protein
MLRDRCEAVLAKYGDSIALGRTSNHVDEIIPAAHAGAVETLFIDPRAKRTGTFDPDELTVSIDEVPRDDREDLVNLAAALVLRNSGTVEPVANVPGGGVMAAVMRYPFPSASEPTATAARS